MKTPSPGHFDRKGCIHKHQAQVTTTARANKLYKCYGAEVYLSFVSSFPEVAHT